MAGRANDMTLGQRLVETGAPPGHSWSNVALIAALPRPRGCAATRAKALPSPAREGTLRIRIVLL